MVRARPLYRRRPQHSPFHPLPEVLLEPKRDPAPTKTRDRRPTPSLCSLKDTGLLGTADILFWPTMVDQRALTVKSAPQYLGRWRGSGRSGAARRRGLVSPKISIMEMIPCPPRDQGKKGAKWQRTEIKKYRWEDWGRRKERNFAIGLNGDRRNDVKPLLQIRRKPSSTYLRSVDRHANLLCSHNPDKNGSTTQPTTNTRRPAQRTLFTSKCGRTRTDPSAGL